MRRFLGALTGAVALFGFFGAAAAAGLTDFEGDWRGGSIDLVTPNPMGDSLRDLEMKINVNKDNSFIILSLARVGRSAKAPDARRIKGLEFKPTTGVANAWQAQTACHPEGPTGCAWARLDGSRLIVTVLDMDKNGEIETQVTVRTLEAGQMKIHFQSFVEGQLRRELRGNMAKYAQR